MGGGDADELIAPPLYVTGLTSRNATRNITIVIWKQSVFMLLELNDIIFPLLRPFTIFGQENAQNTSPV